MTGQLNNDENDLNDLLIYLVKIFKKRFFLILSVVLIITSFGVYNHFISEKCYVSNTIILNSKLIKSKKDIQLEGAGTALLYSLSDISNDKDFETIAKKLNLDIQVVELLDKIEVSPVKESLGSSEIKLYFNKPVDADQVMASILNYLNNNSFIKDNVLLINEKDKMLLNDINVEINLLKNTVDEIVNSEKNKDGLAYIYPRLSELYKEKSDIEYSLKLKYPYYLLEDNECLEVKTSLIFNAAKYFAYSIFLSILMILVLETMEFVRKI